MPCNRWAPTASTMSQMSFGRGVRRQAQEDEREVFLEEMELVVPWKALLALIVPHYPAAGVDADRTCWNRCCAFT